MGKETQGRTSQSLRYFYAGATRHRFFLDPSFFSACNRVVVDSIVNGPHLQWSLWDHFPPRRGLKGIPLSFSGNKSSVEIKVFDYMPVDVIIGSPILEFLEAKMNTGHSHVTVTIYGTGYSWGSSTSALAKPPLCLTIWIGNNFYLSLEKKK